LDLLYMYARLYSRIPPTPSSGPTHTHVSTIYTQK
jgi:hypothetical protein